jgi:hypothetical protein
MATGHGRKNVDEIVLTVLAAGGSPAAAAQQAHCSERTVRRRLQDPAFRQKVDEARAKMVADAVGRLSVIGTLAADVLHGLLSSHTERVRLLAARSSLELMLRGTETVTLVKQVEELKTRLAQVENLKLRVFG